MAKKRVARFPTYYLPERGHRGRSLSYRRSAIAFRILFLTGLLLGSGDYNQRVAAGEHAATPPPPEEPALAYLYGEKLYCLHIIERLNDGPRPPRLELWKAKLTLDDAIVKEKQQIAYGNGVAREDVLFRCA